MDFSVKASPAPRLELGKNNWEDSKYTWYSIAIVDSELLFVTSMTLVGDAS